MLDHFTRVTISRILGSVKKKRSSRRMNEDIKRRIQELDIDAELFKQHPSTRTAEEQDKWIRKVMETASTAGQRAILQAIRAVGTDKEGDSKARNIVIGYLQKGNQEPLTGKETEEALKEFTGQSPGGKMKPPTDREHP